MKNMSFKILLSLVIGSHLIGGANMLHAAEVDSGIVIVDRKPWKVSWIEKDEKTWVLLADFDEGELRTHFKQPPPKTGFGLDRTNKPTKQEFEFFGGQKFVSTTCQYEQWPDGAKAWAFTFDDKFKRDNQTFRFGTTAVVEEVGDADNEIRYAIFREFE